MFGSLAFHVERSRFVARSNTTSRFDSKLLDKIIKGLIPKTIHSSIPFHGEQQMVLAVCVLGAELDHRSSRSEKEVNGNYQNGTSPKTFLASDELMRQDVPRERAGRFESALVTNCRPRLLARGAEAITKYARRMTTQRSR